MTRIYREAPNAGPVLGIAVDRKSGGPIDICARKAVIIGTGGSTGNVHFRRMFDLRLTEEYCGLAGMPWSDQLADCPILRPRRRLSRAPRKVGAGSTATTSCQN
jgi:hypothetical protein